MGDRIRLTHEDLYSPAVDEIVAEQQALARAMPGFQPTPMWRTILFSSLFFLSVAGILGGLTGWAILEPFINEGITLWGTIEDVQLPAGDSQGRMLRVRGLTLVADERVTRVSGRGEHEGVHALDDLRVGQPICAQAMILRDQQNTLMGTRIVVREIPPEHQDEPVPDLKELSTASLFSGVFGFAIVGASIAGLIAAADGLMSRNLRRGMLSGVCGIGIASVGGLVGLLPGGMVLFVAMTLVSALAKGPWTSDSVTGWGLVALAVGRSLTWGILGLTVGLGQGAAMRSKKLLVNGLLGGMLGGLLGGVFFDPICKVFADTATSGQAIVSRAIGFPIIGLSVGLMIGLVEHLAKDAWLLMRAGPLTGKQFVLYKNPTAIGSSPKCEVYLFKDPDVEPRHALIHQTGSRHEIQDIKSPSGTYVNGQRVSRQTLRDGDQIVIGQTVLEYSQRARAQR